MSLLKFPLCSCMLTTFPPRSFNRLIIVFSSHFLMVSASGPSLSLVLFTAFFLQNGSFLASLPCKFDQMPDIICKRKTVTDVNSIHSWKWACFRSVRLVGWRGWLNVGSSWARLGFWCWYSYHYSPADFRLLQCCCCLALVRGLEHWRVFLSLPAPPLAFGTPGHRECGGWFLSPCFLSFSQK